MTDDLPGFDATTAPTLNGAEGRKCKRHTWSFHSATEDFCGRCGARKDPTRSRRGRTSLRAGKDAERHIARAYGGKRTGQYGGPDDVVVGELFVVQSKVRGAFPNWMWDELSKLPRAGGRIPTLIVSDRPGSGHPTRRLVIRFESDDVALHGDKP
jgi:hypothetical protein